jgi:hypothetical protein
MTKKIIKKLAIGGLFSLLVVIAIGIGLHTNIIKLPIERQIYPLNIADFSNDKILMGASHNVFVGKVVKLSGNKERDIGPETQFEVEVVLNIKGDLSGTVIVDQQGGYVDGILYLVHGGDVIAPDSDGSDPLLLPGSTYLFTSRYNEEENWYTIISHPNARKVISEDKNLDIAKLKILAENDEKVKKLIEAYKNEILLDADVKSNNARNNYQSL